MNKRVPLSRVILTWVTMIALIVGIAAFFVWRDSLGMSGEAPETAPGSFHSVFLFILGVFGLGFGIVAYLITVATCCFTFNFHRRVWESLRAKIFLANIFVPLISGLGLGGIISAVLAPTLASRGISGFVPFIGTIVLFQIVQLWVMIWAPLERRVIVKRVAALGISEHQIQGGFLVGLSDPTAGTLQRMGTIETDMGVLWIGPEQLVFWGDAEQFGLRRSQILTIEQRMDARSNTALGGIAHVILHAQMPSGAQRQIRLHTEALWTLGHKRRVMNDLAQRITTWHSAVAVPPPIPS